MSDAFPRILNQSEVTMNYCFKRLISLLALVLAVLLFTVCAASCSSGREPEETQSIPSESVAELSPVFSDSFTNEKLKEVIVSKKASEVNIRANKGDVVKFRIVGGKDVSGCSVIRIAAVDVYYPEQELVSYTDLFLPIAYDETSGIFSIDTEWWYSSTGWVAESDTWGHVIEVKDASGNLFYYYFRVIFQ